MIHGGLLCIEQEWGQARFSCSSILGLHILIRGQRMVLSLLEITSPLLCPVTTNNKPTNVSQPADLDQRTRPITTSTSRHTQVTVKVVISSLLYLKHFFHLSSCSDNEMWHGVQLTQVRAETKAGAVSSGLYIRRLGSDRIFSSLNLLSVFKSICILG